MNANRTPDQIEADINDVRERMDSTLDNLEQRLDARRLIREGLDHLRNSDTVKYAVKAAASAGRVARDYPLPAAIAGASLLGLVAWGVRSGLHAGSRRDPMRKVSDAVDNAKTRLQDAREALADSTRGARRKARKAAGDAWHEVEHAGSAAGSVLRRHPVSSGILGLAVIAAAAAAIPSVRDKIQDRG